MKIALTGGTGFVGHHVAKRLIQQGHQVSALVRNPNDPTSADLAAIGCHRTVIGQMGDPDSINELCRQQDAVVHCAWWTPGKSFTQRPDDVETYYLKNVIGSINLLQSSKRAGVKRFVFVSTGAVHGKTMPGDLTESHPLWPTTIYGAAKSAIETAIHAFGLEPSDDDFCPSTVRPTSIYGIDRPIQNSRFYDLVAAIAKQEKVDLEGGGKMIHVDDLARAIGTVLLAAPEDVRGETFNCTGGLITRQSVASIAREILGIDDPAAVSDPANGKTMRTNKIEQLGMRFDQPRRLRETIVHFIESLEPR